MFKIHFKQFWVIFVGGTPYSILLRLNIFFFVLLNDCPYSLIQLYLWGLISIFREIFRPPREKKYFSKGVVVINPKLTLVDFLGLLFLKASLSSPMTRVALLVAWMGLATPRPSASHWAAPPRGPAPPHSECAASSLSHAEARAVRIIPTPPWHLTQSALIQTPAPTHSANQILMFASSELIMRHFK